MGRTMIGSSKPQIDFGTINNIRNFVSVYHGDEDTFFLRPANPRPATSFDWDGDIWLRVDPASGEIVGIEIDDFESIFLKKHPEIAKAWEEVKPHCLRKKSEETMESFILIIWDFLQKLFRENPQQASLNMMPNVA